MTTEMTLEVMFQLIGKQVDTMLPFFRYNYHIWMSKKLEIVAIDGRIVMIRFEIDERSRFDYFIHTHTHSI